MKSKQDIIVVVFNASVLLAGLYNPNGGSGRLLSFQRSGKINGVISEIILDEALRHADKIGKSQSALKSQIFTLFPHITPMPSEKTVDTYLSLAVDRGDAHLFATAEETHASILVSLDKFHVLALKGKIPHLIIYSPGECIFALS